MGILALDIGGTKIAAAHNINATSEIRINRNQVRFGFQVCRPKFRRTRR